MDTEQFRRIVANIREQLNTLEIIIDNESVPAKQIDLEDPNWPCSLKQLDPSQIIDDFTKVFDINLENRKALFVNLDIRNDWVDQCKQSIFFQLDGTSQINDISYNSSITSDIELVDRYRPYDYIIAYKVLDEIREVSADNILRSIYSICDKNTIVLLICEPWTSRFGGNLPELKHWKHIFMNFTEYNKVQESSGKLLVNKHVRPRAIYQSIILQNSFEIVRSDIRYSAIDAFFDDDKIQFLIKNVWQNTITIEQAKSIMCCDSIGYLLKRS